MDDSQDWAPPSAAQSCAAQRHAEGWDDAGAKMDAWLAAKSAKAVEAAIAEEREACAKVCDEREADASTRLKDEGKAAAAFLCAAAIRARTASPAPATPPEE